MRYLFLWIGFLPLFLFADHHPAPQVLDLITSDQWTKLEIGLLLEGDHDKNKKISGSCIRFLKLDNSGDIVFEVLYHRRGDPRYNTEEEVEKGYTWYFRESKKVKLIDRDEMKEIIQKFDQLASEERAEWNALPEKEMRKRFSELLAIKEFRSVVHFKIERNNRISSHGTYIGSKFPGYTDKVDLLIKQLGK